MKMSTGKAKAAALVAVGNFAGIVAIALSDGEINNDDTGNLITAVVAGALSVYGVWKVRNVPISAGPTYNSGAYRKEESGS